MTFDCDTLTGTLVDPAGSGYRCSRHHDNSYRFCPSEASECKCEPSSLAVCSSVGGDRIFVICCDKCEAQSEQVREDKFLRRPNCDIFHLLPSPPSNAQGTRLVSVTMAADSNDQLHVLGGLSVRHGTAFSLIHCSHDLQEFENGDETYKSGHSHLVTKITLLADTPEPSTKMYSCLKGQREWRDSGQRLPEALSDSAATFTSDDALWMVGGAKVAYDDDIRIFYQVS